MRAVRLYVGEGAKLVEMEDPVAGPGEVIIRVAANGLCQSDLHLIDNVDVLPYPMPFTLGHQTAGRVESLGEGVTGLNPEDPVGVYSLSSCHVCPSCIAESPNLCRTRFPDALGFGSDGGLADRMRVPAGQLVTLGDLDPVKAAPLMDAGLTACAAVRQVRARLVLGARCVVIGVGGLGHLAVQALSATTDADIIGVDISEERLQLGSSLGARWGVLAREGAASEIEEICEGVGTEVVLDFVGSQDSLDLATSCVATGGKIVIVGLASGQLPVVAASSQRLAHGVEVSVSIYGSRPDLRAAIAPSRAGQLAATTTFELEESMSALQALRDGLVLGRVVVTP